MYSRRSIKINIYKKKNEKTLLGLLGTGRRGEGVMEVVEDGSYIPIATLSPPE